MNIQDYLYSEFDSSIVEEFLMMLDVMEDMLDLTIERLYSDYKEAVNDLFRMFHNLKSAAGFLKIKRIQNYAHFVEDILGLHHSFPTTQIEHYDHLAAFFDALKRINTIIIDLDRDVWQYISMGYFKQKIKKGEVGSSAMPHKVNPIDFENSEGNMGIANAIFEHLSAKLPVSRLQRDLTDSTVLRNVGVPFGHTLIGFRSTLKGLNKLLLNREAIEKDLEDNWAVVAEAIQTILRREAYPNPYEALKGLTRTNKKIDQSSISEFIDTLQISDELKNELKSINPGNYTGIQS